MTEAKDLTDKQVLELAKEHVEHFQRMLRWQDKTVRPEECKHYLDIWRGVLDLWKDHPTGWRGKLSPEALNEIQDAVESGDYDDLLEASK
jgi:hypothetical protein